jgi:aminoglycoside 6'-N-acetyltransferase
MTARRIVLRALVATDAPELRRIRATPEVARWWEAPEEEFPLVDEPDVTRWTIEVGGAVGGMVQFADGHGWHDGLLMELLAG